MKMADAKKRARTDALEKVKALGKELGFTVGMLNGALTDGRKKK